MKITIALLLTFLVVGVAGLADTAPQKLIVYGPVPGLAPSDHYTVRVRPAGTAAPWQKTFVLQTECKTGESTGDSYHAYWKILGGWSHSYVNLETSVPVAVEVAKSDGSPIHKATVHPQRFGTDLVLKDGKAFFTLERNCLASVDIDGAMSDNDTGLSANGRYRGPPVHTLSIFANPILSDRPQPDDPGVLVVKPGVKPPEAGDWKTLFFLPGQHDIGGGFQMRAGRKYYIPGDAIVYGTFQCSNAAEGRDLRLFGYGTLSGARLEHPGHSNPPINGEDERHALRSPVYIRGADQVRVEGITVADPAYHSLNLYGGGSASNLSAVRWVKIIGWRANGDGITPYTANQEIEDCFLRTQDDALYALGTAIRRLVIWNDANGSAFLLSKLSNLREGGVWRPMVVEDCDVIFARNRAVGVNGGRIFNMRGSGSGESGRNVVFQNIRLEDPRPTQQAFLLQMATAPPYQWGASQTRRPGDLDGILFQNIEIAAPSVMS